MKKSVKILLICVGCILLTTIATIAIMLGMIAGNKQNIGINHPAEQPGTTWTTENGEVTFYVNGDIGHGTIQSNNGPVQIAVKMSPLTSEIRIYYEEEYQQMVSNQPIGFGFAQGQGIVRNNRKFIIKITSANEHFEVGEKLVFYKTVN